MSAVTVGLTGGIGSGKSTVSRMLESKGAVLIDADAIAREVVAPGGPAYGPVVGRFGDSVVAADGTIDRQALAEIVFSDPEALADLNAVTHPVIGQLMVERRAAAEAAGAVVVMDIPLLKATHREQIGFDVVVVVDAPVDVAVARLVDQRGSDAPMPRPVWRHRSRGRSVAHLRTWSSTTAATSMPSVLRWTGSGPSWSRVPDDLNPMTAREERLAFLDGVRAFAVCAVLLYHAGVAGVSGGLLGVDVFFVLSGFLITGLLCREHLASRTIRLAQFWAARARRLLPALFVLLLGVALYAWAFRYSLDLSSIRGDAIVDPSVRGELAFHLVGSGLFHRVDDSVAAPAYVVTRRGGAVLRHLAARLTAGPATERTATARLGRWRGCCRLGAVDGLHALRRTVDGPSVLRDRHAGSGAARRLGARGSGFTT